MRLHAVPSRLGARPRGPEPVSWSPDERVSVSTERGVRVAEMLLLHGGGGGGGEEEEQLGGDPRLRLRVTALQIPTATYTVSVGPEQDEAAARAQLEEPREAGTLSAYARHEFALQRGFVPTYGANVPLNGGCVRAHWSPVGCDERGRSLLACLSAEGFISLWVWAERDVHTWSCIADLTQMYGDILKRQNYHAADGASLKDFDEFKRRSEMQSPVSMEWSRMFITTHVRDKSGACEELRFSLLAVLMVSGHIVVWQVLVPASTSAHVVLGSVLESGLESPRSLSWWACHVGSQNINGLIVGDSMGQVRLLPVNLSAVKGYFTLRQPVTLWSTKDGLSVNFIRTLDMASSADMSAHGGKPSVQASSVLAARRASTGTTEQATLQSSNTSGGPPRINPVQATSTSGVRGTASASANVSPKPGTQPRASPGSSQASSTTQCGRMSVVLAARGPHLLACVVCVIGGGMSVQTAHITGLHPQPICGMAAIGSDSSLMSGSEGMVYTASADGSLCCVWPVVCTSGDSDGDVSVSIPATLGQKRWVRFERRVMRLPGRLSHMHVCGLTASPNGAFLAVLTTEGLLGGDSKEEETVVAGGDCQLGRLESAEKQQTQKGGGDLDLEDDNLPITLGFHPRQRTYSLSFISLIDQAEAFRRLVSVPLPDSLSSSTCGLAFLRADLLEILRSHVHESKGQVPTAILAELDRLMEQMDNKLRWRDRGRWATYLARVRLYMLRFAFQARGRPRPRWVAFSGQSPPIGTNSDRSADRAVGGVNDETMDGIKDEDDDDDDFNAGGKLSTADATQIKSTEALGEGTESKTESDWLVAEIRRRERVLAQGAACRILERAFLCTRFDLHLHLPARGLLNFITSGGSNAHTTDAQVLAANILKKMGKQDIQEKCVLCAAVIPFESHAKAVCANGHQWPRCAVTFAACQTWRYRRCILHDSVAAFPKATDPEWMKLQLDSPCVYCDSPYL